MTNFDNETTRKLMNSRTYKTAIHHVANQLHISDKDAAQLVFMALMNRLKNKDWSITAKLKTNDNQFNWLITWSSRDAVQAYYHSEQKQKQAREELKKYSSNSYLIDLEKPADSLNEVEKAKIIKLLPQLFKQKTTIEFCADILKKGKMRTMETEQLTERQFYKKLKNIERYCNEHREKFVNVVISKEQAHMLKQQKILKEFISLIESTNYTDAQFQSLLDYYHDYMDDLAGTIPNLKEPVVLLDNWQSAPKQSQYKLINKIYADYQFLSRQLMEK